jgi:fibronectin type 3 domain-containing protein
LIADSPDNLHPSETGYQWMAETWYRKILVIPFPPVEIKAALMVRAGHVELSWKNDPKILAGTKLASYKIYRKAGDEAAFGAVATVNSPLSGYQDKAVSPAKDYTYVLSSINSDKVEGPFSEPVNPVRGDPYAPQNVVVQTLRNRALFYAEHINQISWQANPQNEGRFTIAKYRIYRKQRGEEDARFELIAEVTSSILKYLDRKISRRFIAESYAYGIAAVDSNNIEGEIGKSPE